MNSQIEGSARATADVRRAGLKEADNGRIVVRTNGEITSLSYRGQNPSTRYLPREQSVWNRIKDAFLMG